MASVGGRRTYLASSDETIQHACGPCKDDGETKEANYLCELCKIHLCFECRNDHKTFKATKNHSVVSAHLAQCTGSTATKSTFAILCDCNQKRGVEVYCEKHARLSVIHVKRLNTGIVKHARLKIKLTNIHRKI